MRGLRVLAAVLVAVMLLAVASPALAFGGTLPDGKVVFGEDFTLEAGETLDGDLAVFGGDVTLEEESQVDGDAVVWGGNVEVAGTVWGDVAVFGGNVYLAETAVIDGDLMVVGGQVDREEGAQVRGQQVVTPQGEGWRWGWPLGVPFFRGWYFPPHDMAGGLLLRLLWQGVQLVLTVVLMAGLAGLVAVLWPGPASRVGRTSLESVLPSLGVGLLTMLVGAVVVLGLLITLCLAPVGLVAAVALGVATVFGWVALGILIGERLMSALTTRSVSPFWTAALGAGLLTLLSNLMGLIPCVGWAGGFLVASIGLGAVVLTRFGTVDYPSAGPPLTASGEKAE